MDVGARQPSNNLIRFDPEERARAQKPGYIHGKHDQFNRQRKVMPNL